MLTLLRLVCYVLEMNHVSLDFFYPSLFNKLLYLVNFITAFHWCEERTCYECLFVCFLKLLFMVDIYFGIILVLFKLVLRNKTLWLQISNGFIWFFYIITAENTLTYCRCTLRLWTLLWYKVGVTKAESPFWFSVVGKCHVWSPLYSL